jgi:hypothetical protein
MAQIESVGVEAIKPYPNNPRRGNVDLIAESLEAYGQYKPITVNRRNGEILAGNHTYRAAVKLGWSEIDVVYVDVDDKTAAKIVAMDNRTSDLGEYDKQILADLLKNVSDLAGTGYTTEEFDDLIASIQERELPKLSDMPSLQVGQTGQNNTYMATNLEDYKERYATRATRMLMADYENDVYVWLIEKLAQFRESRGIASNSDAILKLVEEVLGEKCPHEPV